MSSSNPVPIRVFIVENHRIILWGLEKLVSTANRPIQVIGSAPTSDEGLKLLKEITADVVLLDIDPDIDNAMKIIRDLVADTQARLLVFTGIHDPALYEKVVLLRCHGCRG